MIRSAETAQEHRCTAWGHHSRRKHRVQSSLLEPIGPAGTRGVSRWCDSKPSRESPASPGYGLLSESDETKRDRQDLDESP